MNFSSFRFSSFILEESPAWCDPGNASNVQERQNNLSFLKEQSKFSGFTQGKAILFFIILHNISSPFTFGDCWDIYIAGHRNTCRTEMPRCLRVCCRSCLICWLLTWISFLMRCWEFSEIKYMLVFYVGDVMNICEHSGKYKELPEVFSEVNTELFSLGLRQWWFNIISKDLGIS